MDLKKYLPILGGLLIGISGLLLVASFFPGFTARADPAIVFLSMAATSFFVIYFLPEHYRWKYWMYVPAFFSLTGGLIFLINALTDNSGSSWAYGWMLLVSGMAAGAALAMQISGYFMRFWKYAMGLAAVSAGLFAFFGMVAGSGAFMRIFSILLLAGQGALLIYQVRRKERADAPASLEPLRGAISEPEKPPVQGAAPEALVEPLSKRELEVLQCIDQGLSNSEIAERLIVAPSTVKTHINNIFSKLGVESRLQAVRRAKDLNLL
jgi:DNA-binding CsgD family transcriptional regulator